MPDPTWLASEPVVLEKLRFVVQRELDDMQMTARTATWSSYQDYLLNRMVVQLRGQVLAERLPPQNIRSQWHGTHRIDVDTIRVEVRHATWWDMFKDTYRRRWWARPLVRRWPPRYVDLPLRWQDTYMRSCRHDITVPVIDRWKYPHASFVPRELGYSVLDTAVLDPEVTTTIMYERPSQEWSADGITGP